jgi:hypothetical protein
MNAQFDGSSPVSQPAYKMNGHNERKLIILKPIANAFFL